MSGRGGVVYGRADVGAPVAGPIDLLLDRYEPADREGEEPVDGDATPFDGLIAFALDQLG